MPHPLIDTTGQYEAYNSGYDDSESGKPKIRPPSKTRRVLSHFGIVVQWALTFLASCFLILYALAQFDGTPPVRFISSDEHVTTAADGKSFFVTRQTCLDRQKPGRGLPRLVGIGTNLLIPLPGKPLAATLGCHVYVVLVRIPDEVPPGEYDYRLTFRFQMNPFKTIDVEASPVRVTVLR